MARIGGGQVESTGWATSGSTQHFVETVAYPWLTRRTEVPCGSAFTSWLPEGWEVKPEPFRELPICKKQACQATYAKRERADA